MLKTIRNHHNVKNFFKRFADQSELVYFGYVDKDDDAHIYKGITFTPNCIDTNYCHGTVSDYDVTAFNRESEYRDLVGQSSTIKWTVVAVHLKIGGLPHAVIDGKRHPKSFYNSVFIRFPRLRRAGALLNQINPSAGVQFELLARPDAGTQISSFMDDSMLQRMLTSFTRYSVEIDNDMLYVYSPLETRSEKDLRDMLAEALWLSETIENRVHMAHPVVAV